MVLLDLVLINLMNLMFQSMLYKHQFIDATVSHPEANDEYIEILNN